MSVGFGLVLVGCGGWVVGGGCLGQFHEGMACWSICLLELYTYLHQISFSKFLTIESIDLLLFSSNNRLIKGFVTRISYNPEVYYFVLITYFTSELNTQAS